MKHSDQTTYKKLLNITPNQSNTAPILLLHIAIEPSFTSNLKNITKQFKIAIKLSNLIANILKLIIDELKLIMPSRIMKTPTKIFYI